MCSHRQNIQQELHAEAWHPGLMFGAISFAFFPSQFLCDHLYCIKSLHSALGEQLLVALDD